MSEGKKYNYVERNSPKSLIIIAIGAALMIALHLFSWNGEKRDTHENVEQSAAMHEDTRDLEGILDALEQSDPIVDIQHGVATSQEMGESNISHHDEEAGVQAKEDKVASIAIVKAKDQKWKNNAVAAHETQGAAKIVLIIDDMGMNKAQSKAVIDLKAHMTLAFLPYASGLSEMTKTAKARGHELMIHMPMEAMNPKMDLGSIALKSGMNEATINKALEQAFDSFDGYVGVNNHMGSRLTQDKNAMHIVMNALAKRGLIFVDSKTIATSVADDVAAQHGLDHARRDVFLDHEDTPAYVEKALVKLERVARAKGFAIGIGHPKAVTVSAIKRWLPTLKAKNIEIVPVSAVVERGRGTEQGVSRAVTSQQNDKRQILNITPTPAVSSEGYSFELNQ